MPRLPERSSQSSSSPSAPRRLAPRLAPRLVPRLARHGLLTTAVAVAVAGLNLGCDEEYAADNTVLGQLEEAYAFRTAGDSERRYTGIAGEAAANQDVSPATGALADELAGSVAVEEANRLIGGPVQSEPGAPPLPGLAQTETLALRLAEQMNLLAQTLALTQIYMQAQQQTNPQPVLQSINQKVQEIRSGETWSAGEATLQSQEQVDARISQLQEQIQSLQEQIQTLEQQRSQTLSQASELDAQAEQQDGEEGIATFEQVTNLRNEAAGMVAEQTLLEAQLRRTQEQLEEAQALRQSLEQAVAALDAQAQTLQASWQGVQSQLQALQQTQQAIYAGDPPSVQALATQLGGALQRMEQLKGQISQLLDQASTSYQTANQQAGSAVAEIRRGNSPFEDAYAGAFDVNRIRLRQGLAQRQQGEVHAGSAAVYAALARLQETLQAAGQQLPGELNIDDPTAAYRQAVDQAASALVTADETISGVAGSGRGELSNAGLAQRALVLSQMLTLRQLVEAVNIEAQPGLPSQQEIQGQIQQVIDAARNGNVRLPLVPGFMEAAIVTPPAPDAGQPQPPTDGTTQPTDQAVQPGQQPPQQPETPAGQGADQAAQEAAQQPIDQPADQGAVEGAEGAPEGGAMDQPPIGDPAFTPGMEGAPQ